MINGYTRKTDVCSIKPFQKVLEPLYDMEVIATMYYNPSICTRPSVFDSQNIHVVNKYLHHLECILRGTDLTIGQIRVLICLITYDGLTSKDIEDLTCMKQSAVSRTITSLAKAGMV
ncbi:MAG: MarR family transcriptional regulator [Candidatus Methanomethylophilaceae archaeon]|nr:MarR family transcriptional regulator [Candidatus Methanomethylophilaceae archaeon]